MMQVSQLIGPLRSLSNLSHCLEHLIVQLLLSHHPEILGSNPTCARTILLLKPPPSTSVQNFNELSSMSIIAALTQANSVWVKKSSFLFSRCVNFALMVSICRG